MLNKERDIINNKVNWNGHYGLQCAQMFVSGQASHLHCERYFYPIYCFLAVTKKGLKLKKTFENRI